MHANFDQLEQYTTGKIARRHALDFLHADESISMIDNASGVLRAYDLPPEQSLIYASESISLAEAADEYAAATEFENSVLQNVPTFQLLNVLVDELVSAGITRFAQYLFLWQKRYLPGPEILASRFGDDYWQQLADTANLLYGPGTIIKKRRSSFKNAPVEKLLSLVHDETERIQARGITDYDARYDRTRSVRSSMLLQRLPGGMEELRQMYRERFHAMVFMAADTRPGKRLTIPNKHTETNFSKWYLTMCATAKPKQSRASRADTVRPHLTANQRAMMIERFGITMQRLGLVNRPLQSLYEERRNRFEPAAERLLRWLRMTWDELLQAAGLPTLDAVVEHESLVASFEQQSQSLTPTLYEFQWRNPQTVEEVLEDDGLASLQTDTLHQQFFINREFSAIAKRYRVVFNANTSLAILLNSFQAEVKRLQSERGSLNYADYEKYHTGQTPSLRLIERVTGLRWDGLLRLVYIVDGKPLKKFAKLQYVDRRRIDRNQRTGQLELTIRRERITSTLRPAPVIVEETSVEELLQAFVAELERLHLTGEPRLVDYQHDRSVTAPSYNVLRRRTGLGWDELLNRVNLESVTQKRSRLTSDKIAEQREKARVAREEQRDKARVSREEQQAQARAARIEAMAQERARFLDDVSDLVHSTRSYRLAEFKEASGLQWRQYLRELKMRFGTRFWETVIEHTYERFGPAFDLRSRPLWSAYPIDWLNSVIGDAIRVNGFRNVTEYKRSRDVETTPSYAEYHRLFLDRGIRPGDSIFAQLVNASGRERVDDEPVLISEG